MMKKYFTTYVACGVLTCCAMLPQQAIAEKLEVAITKDIQFTVVNYADDLVKIQRIQDPDHTIDGSFAKTSRPCPPFCVNPLHIAEGVVTVAELEVLEFMETSYSRGNGLVIDARTPSWYKKGTIPGSMNIPFTVFEKPADDPELAEVLEMLGARERGSVGTVMRMLEKTGMFDGAQKTDEWDFSAARELLLWCNGPWCGQSPLAIHALLKLGYPAEKLYYYRGGMQMWQSLGLTTVVPKDESRFVSKSSE